MFGRYRLDEKLGAGGVGEVWRAYDTTLRRVVAIKMLLPRFRDDAESAARFHREAQMAAGLRHPHVVRVHSFGEAQSAGEPPERRLYIDMELIEGVSLAAALAASGPWDPVRALEVADPVARALDAAHNLDGDPDKRLVHRDVKPANVLIESFPGGREHVYLVDFGIARAVAPGQSLTGAGVVVGTPAYMAPELWGEGRPDHRIDVYALAAMLFEMITGRLPFPRSSVESFIAAHLREPVPAASGVRPGLPRGLDEVIARGLAKDPDDRYGSAGDLVRAATAAVGAAGRDTVDIPAARPLSLPVVPVRSPPVDPPLTDPSRRRPEPPIRVPEKPVGEPDVEPVRVPRAGSWFSAPPHFVGLAATALLVPLYLLDRVRVDWSLFLPFLLLYGLGAVLTLAVRPRRR